MASTNSHKASLVERETKDILNFWFDGEDPTKKWFAGGSIDVEIKEQFEPVMKRVFTELQDGETPFETLWMEKPKSSLALLILLDQFTRNVFRDTRDSFSKDKIARDIATRAIALGFDREVEPLQQTFFYMPYMHGESEMAQVACLAQMELLIARCESDSVAERYVKLSHAFAKKHLDVILQFGRFPSRNKILGRESSKSLLR